MGCAGSKAGGEEGYATIGVEKLDAIFEKAQNVQDQVAEITDALDGGKMTMFENAGQEYLKEPALSKAVQCFLYSVACSSPDPAAFKPEISAEEPYVSLPEELPLSDANKAFKEALVAYIQCIKAAPEKAEAMTTELQAIADEAAAAKDTAADDMGELSGMEKMKAMKALGGNTKKLAAAKDDVAALPETLKTAAEDLKKLIESIPDALKACKENVDKTKALGTDTASATIAKSVIAGDKNDDATAKKYAEANYKKPEPVDEKKEESTKPSEEPNNQM